jgi:2-polyprenyl-3-methyl-5-hydroxy-6-metoxy-1,4-benzoquinol methylase
MNLRIRLLIVRGNTIPATRSRFTKSKNNDGYPLTNTLETFDIERLSATSDSIDVPVCPYCAGTSKLLVATTDVNRGTTSSVFRYYQCGLCRLVFMHPIPSDMRPFYAGGYQKIPSGLAALRAIAAGEKYRMKPILRYKSSGSLLDIGPWIGIFACNAKDAGFEVTALEIDQNCVNFLNGTVGVKAIQSSDPAKSLGEMTEQFDVITLWHSLEHLPDPWLVVQRAAERLAPDGILLIAIPNITSNEFAMLKAKWRHIDAPRHIYFYPPDALAKLASDNGLIEHELTTNDELSRALGKEAWHYWAVDKFRIKYLRGAVGRLLFYLSRLRGRDKRAGSSMTAVFGKPK